jgi:hypothetical protein
MAVLCIGIAILATINGLRLIQTYQRVQSIRAWDIPPETEIIDFQTDGFYPIQKCFPICIYTGTLYLVSSLPLSDLASFYGNLDAEHGYGSGSYRLRVMKSENLHEDGRPIYTVSLTYYEPL